MEEDDSMSVDYSKGLPKDLDEETRMLLILAKQHNLAKDIHVSKQDVVARSKEKSIPNYEARRELLAESTSEREQLVNYARNVLTRNATKETKTSLGVKGAGRRKGSKNKAPVMSKTDCERRLKELAKSKNQIGEELKQEDAAKALGLGGTRQLRAKLKEYGYGKWKEVLTKLLVE
jgi:hypothetical protein